MKTTRFGKELREDLLATWMCKEAKEVLASSVGHARVKLI
jgi:hypothetical protein